MEPLYGAGINVWPYIISAYSLGATALIVFSAWLLLDRRKLSELAAKLDDTNTTGGRS